MRFCFFFADLEQKNKNSFHDNQNRCEESDCFCVTFKQEYRLKKKLAFFIKAVQRDKNEQEENKSAENHKIAAQRHRDGFFSSSSAK